MQTVTTFPRFHGQKRFLLATAAVSGRCDRGIIEKFAIRERKAILRAPALHTTATRHGHRVGRALTHGREVARKASAPPDRATPGGGRRDTTLRRL